MDMTKLAKAHLAIRDRRKALTDEFNRVDGDLKTKQELLEGQMLKHLLASNMDSVKTAAGTIYRQKTMKPAASDWDAFYSWIKENDAFDALERRIKAAFIKEHMAENDGELPPGVSVYRENVARVRRA